MEVYVRLQALGLVVTVGTYRQGQLVGGIWGLGIGRVFSIMGTFHLENHAGALALAALAKKVAVGGRWSMIDCGTINSNWERYGAKEITAEQFSELVIENLNGGPESPSEKAHSASA